MNLKTEDNVLKNVMHACKWWREWSYLCWLLPHVPLHQETSEWICNCLHTFQPGNEEVLCSDWWILCLGAKRKKREKIFHPSFSCQIHKLPLKVCTLPQIHTTVEIPTKIMCRMLPFCICPHVAASRQHKWFKAWQKKDTVHEITEHILKSSNVFSHLNTDYTI